MEWIEGWARTLTFYFVILSAVMYLLPESGEKKQVQYYMGVLLLLILVKPLLKAGSAEDLIDRKLLFHTAREHYGQLKKEVSLTEWDETAYFGIKVEEQMKNEIQKLSSDSGMQVDDCRIIFGGKYHMEPYAVFLEGRKVNEEAQVETIKRFLSDVYNIPPGNINIKIQE